MFVFGHIGIGRQIVHTWRSRLPAVPLIVGTLLPDLIDKPLYYSRVSDFISCTRTFGHTGILLLLLVAAAYLRQSKALTALALGMATHLLLDCLIDWPPPGQQSSAWVALVWPLMGGHFFTYHFASVRVHLVRLLAGRVVISELLGLMLIGMELWRRPAPIPLVSKRRPSGV